MFGPTDKIAILGRSGSGKTFLSRTIQKIYPRVLVIDFMREYSDGDVVTSFQEFSEKLLAFKTERRKRFRLIFQFPPAETEVELIFDHILKTAYAAGNLLVVIEEVQMYSHSHHLGHWLRQCLLTGRHRNLALIFTTQRPGELHKTILSQCSHIFCGQIHEKNDLKYLDNYFYKDAEKLQKLQPQFFLYWRPGSITAIVHNSLARPQKKLLDRNSLHSEPLKGSTTAKPKQE